MNDEPKKLSYNEVVELLQSGIGVPGVPIYNPVCTYPDGDQQITIEALLKLKKEFQHSMCRCTLEPPSPQLPTEINELGCKLAARIVLADHTPKIILPSRGEWLGVNLLEGDDDLPPRVKSLL